MYVIGNGGDGHKEQWDSNLPKDWYIMSIYGTEESFHFMIECYVLIAVICNIPSSLKVSAYNLLCRISQNQSKRCLAMWYCCHDLICYAVHFQL